MGRLAAEIVLKLLAGEKPDSHVTLAGKLIVRQTTAPPAARRP
jgi:DNA-binding LacI/PurR family transcriptional regulator